MRAYIHAFVIGGLAAAVACSSADQLTVGGSPSLLLNIAVDDSSVYPDMYRPLLITATDGYGNPVSSSDAVLTTSDSTVAAIEHVDTIPVAAHPAGSYVSGLRATIHLRAPGTATLHESLEDVTQATVITVQPLPPVTNAMVVDSFTVIESGACASPCYYLTYSPILRLRNTSQSSEEAISVEVTVPGATIGFCSGSVWYNPGESANLIYYQAGQAVSYASDLNLFSYYGVPVPDGPARANVIVRDSDGVLGLVHATGVIQRKVASPVLPFTNDQRLLTFGCG